MLTFDWEQEINMEGKDREIDIQKESEVSTSINSDERVIAIRCHFRSRE